LFNMFEVATLAPSTRKGYAWVITYRFRSMNDADHTWLRHVHFGRASAGDLTGKANEHLREQRLRQLAPALARTTPYNFMSPAVLESQLLCGPGKDISENLAQFLAGALP
jgi:hypothetical protein